MRFFDTTGPVVPADHYCIPPLERVNLDEVLGLVRDKRYFVLHTPRQTGKTSALLALQDLLNGGAAGDYRCVYANVEAGQALREDVAGAMRAIFCEMELRARPTLRDESLARCWPDILGRAGPGGAFRGVLARWAEAEPRPLVLLIDGIDSLLGDTLLSVLRQLRAGYDQRLGSFPQSVVLCGVRDVRDYPRSIARAQAHARPTLLTPVHRLFVQGAVDARAQASRRGEEPSSKRNTIAPRPGGGDGPPGWSATRGPWSKPGLPSRSRAAPVLAVHQPLRLRHPAVVNAKRRVLERPVAQLHLLAERSSNPNGFLPSCAAGRPWNDAVSATESGGVRLVRAYAPAPSHASFPPRSRIPVVPEKPAFTTASAAAALGSSIVFAYAVGATNPSIVAAADARAVRQLEDFDRIAIGRGIVEGEFDPEACLNEWLVKTVHPRYTSVASARASAS